MIIGPTSDQLIKVNSFEKNFIYCKNRSVRLSSSQVLSLSFKRYATKFTSSPYLFQTKSFQNYFYIESTYLKKYILGLGSILHNRFYGSNCFIGSKKISRKIYNNTSSATLNGKLSDRPLLFNKFNFFDFSEKKNNTSSPSFLFMPYLQLIKSSDSYIFTLNILTNSIIYILPKLIELNILYRKAIYILLIFDQKTELNLSSKLPTIVFTKSDWYEKLTFSCINNIYNGRYEKIVVARTKDFYFKYFIEINKVLSQLRNEFPNCFTFFLKNNYNQSFIGSTPEKLLKIDRKKVQIEVVAGSTSINISKKKSSELTKQLQYSRKNKHEHFAVVFNMINILRQFSLRFKTQRNDIVLFMKNVQHLATEINSNETSNKHILDIACLLHPSAAIGGSPEKIIKLEIYKLEPFARNLYTGTMGCFDNFGSGSMVVCVRSALLSHAQSMIRLYAGAGIVNASTPSSEKKETNIKMNAILNILRKKNTTM